METTPCIIQGFIWRGNVLKTFLNAFIGEIQLADDGVFEGFTTDYYGRAAIKGKVDGAALEFSKLYDPDSRGAKGEIDFLLRAQGYGNPGEIVCGGWKGVYTLRQQQVPGIKEPVDDRRGEASCLIYPLP